VEGYKFLPWAPYGHSGSVYMWARALDLIEHYPGAAPCLTIKE